VALVLKRFSRMLISVCSAPSAVVCAVITVV
jgi:hypothetical protein